MGSEWTAIPDEAWRGSDPVRRGRIQRAWKWKWHEPDKRWRMASWCCRPVRGDPGSADSLESALYLQLAKGRGYTARILTDMA
ncbi:uncharacterized protein Triagg1_6849 [Trichoderma aggressivum f. europaeum]|uniref:Uncharacterized protein n=1 Tax=Trichoderma aggressivum f. europaeum TaxID=173218 RepID=A0AAE1M3G4_9HYPO|nr:hypothetical protein Triagg1_6849 [Trichoderma aggressivum f. europaeum]